MKGWLRVGFPIPRNGEDLIYHMSDTLFKNTIHLISTTFATSVLGFIFWFIAAKFYSSTQVGLASAAITSMNLLVMLSLLGFNISLIRFLPSSSRKDIIINSYFTLCLTMSIIISLIYLMVLRHLAPDLLFLKQNLTHEILFIGFTGIWSITTLISSVLISNRTTEYVLIKESIFGLSKIPMPILLVSSGAFGIFFSWGIGLAIAVIFGFIFLLKINPSYRPRALIDRGTIRDTFSFSTSNYLANLFYIAPSLVLPTMVAAQISPRTAAYFYISWMIANLLFTIPVQASQSLFAEGSNEESAVDSVTIKSVKYILLLLVPSVAIILILGDRLLLLFGREYSNQGIQLLQLLAVSSIPYAIGSVYVANKRIKKENMIVLSIYGLLASTTLLGSYFLLGRIGLIGIGYSWMSGNMLIVFIVLLLSFKNK